MESFGFDLAHLRAFVAVFEAGHFGRAAGTLHLAQPALSKRIAVLERQLGVGLFERGSRGVRPTPAARVLYPKATDLLTRFGDAVAVTRAAGAGRAGRLRIGYVDAAASVFLPAGMRRLRREFPDLEISLRAGASGALVEALAAGHLDVVFVLFAPPDPALHALALDTDPVRVLLPDDHPLAAIEPLTLSALADADWILFPRELNPHFHDLLIAACDRAGFSPRVVAEVSPRQNAVARVAAGEGVTFLSAGLAHLAMPGTVHRARAPPTPEIPFYRVTAAGRRAVPEAILDALAG